MQEEVRGRTGGRPRGTEGGGGRKEGGRERGFCSGATSGWSRGGGGGGGGDDIGSPPLLQDQMESFAELICGRVKST